MYRHALFWLLNHAFCVGLPTVLYFPGRPVLQPIYPASWLWPPLDALCPIFQQVCIVSSKSYADIPQNKQNYSFNNDSFFLIFHLATCKHINLCVYAMSGRPDRQTTNV